VKESTIAFQMVVVTNGQSPIVAQPGDPTLDLPTLAVTAQMASIVERWSFAAATMRADHQDFAGQQILPARGRYRNPDPE
jgi:hypothetical protein